MIQEADLKINNWVSHNGNWSYRTPNDNKPFLFKWESRDWYALHECTLFISDISPIILTPELLTDKCGFLHHFGSTNFTTGTFDINFDRKDGMLYLDIEGQLLPLPIKFMHELQNLVYDLSKQELKVNL